MIDTTGKPYEVVFNGVKYRLLSHGKYYLSQSNTNKGRRNAKSLHVAIWEHYNEKPVPKGFNIHHKDGNTFNNDISNLECVNTKEHLSKHGKNNWQNKEFRENGIKQLNSIRDKAKEWHKSKAGLEWHQKIKYAYSRPVEQYEINGKKITSFLSMKDASDITGVSYSSITKCASGKIKTGGGYVWKYAEVEH